MYSEDVATAKPHNWVTVSFQPLPPGWSNRFVFTEEVIIADCPGVLIQELRSRDVCSGGRYIRSEYIEPPYQTRAVFAYEFEGEVLPAIDDKAYDQTIAPNQEVTE